MRTIDITVSELCDEIDYWKEQANHYKEKYEQQVQERSVESKERLLEAQKGVATALMFALHSTDDKDGNLVISKESREKISKQYKS